MIALYSICFVLGGFFVALAALGGLDGADFETDFETDITGVEGEGETEQPLPASFLRVLLALLPLLNLRFWMFASFIFGLMGLLLRLLQPDLGVTPRFAIALTTGILFGSIGVGVLRWLRTQGSTNSLVEADDLVGAEGVVEIPFDAESRGKIKVEVKGSRIYMKAMTSEARSFQAGDRVLVLGLEGNCAWVVSEESAQSLSESI